MTNLSQIPRTDSGGMFTEGASGSSDPILFILQNWNLTQRTDERQAVLTSNINDFFLLVMGALVYLMQPGFAFLEAGTIRKKNVTNTLFRLIIGSLIVCVSYWLFGWAFAFGHPSNSFIGYGDFALSSNNPTSQYSLWFYEFTFAAACTSIVSGGLVERTDVFAYFVYTSFVSSFIYAIIIHWTWTPEGWLNNLSFNGISGAFQDFAGSGGVHVCGGVCALAGMIVLGPRIGRFKPPSEVLPATTTNGPQAEKEFQSHSVPLLILGGTLLMCAFFGFNGGSQLHISEAGDGQLVALVFINTIISGSTAGLAAVFLARLVLGHWSLIRGINGALAGMVAICSGCNVMYPWSAAVTGFVAGLVYSFWAVMVPKLKVDDPLETVALHVGAGSWGLVATALFDKSHGIVFYWTKASFYALGYQVLGLLAIIAWSFGLAGTMFGLLRLCHMRVPAVVEMTGLDETKHQECAYASRNNSRVEPAARPRTITVINGSQRDHFPSQICNTVL